MAKESTKRILSIDYGLARIGLALSDPTQTIASPFRVISTEKTVEKTVEKILQEIEDIEIECIVIGLPLLLSGKDSKTTIAVRAFANIVEEKSKMPTILYDERLTSKEVERLLIAEKIKRKKRTKYIDTLSATLILQTYLSQKS